MVLKRHIYPHERPVGQGNWYGHRIWYRDHVHQVKKPSHHAHLISHHIETRRLDDLAQNVYRSLYLQT